MNQDQDWTEAYKEMCLIVNPNEDKTKGIPEIKHQDLWTEQVDYLPEEYPWPPNSLFYNFNAISVKTIGNNVQEILMAVDVIFTLDSLAETYFKSETQEVAFAFMQICKKIHKLFQGKSGKNFSSMDRTGLGRVPAPPYLRVFRQTYQTIILDYTGTKDMKEATITSFGLTQGERPVDGDAFKLFETNL